LLVAVLVCVALLLYIRSPIDLRPDRMGVLGLIDDLLVAFAAIWWLRRRATQARPRMTARQRARGHAGRAGASSASAGGGARPAEEDERPWDPYAVLGVARGASGEEIVRAYRAQMKLYHPDRVADLGEELRDVAHRKALEIQRAYEEVGRS
jgi:DnaJ like chaperone protein